MKPLHVTVGEVWGTAKNGSSRVTECLTLHKPQTEQVRCVFKSSGAVGSLSLRNLYPILSSPPAPRHQLLATRHRTCWDRTLLGSCLRLRTLCKRLPNTRRRVPRSVLHRRTIAPNATRKYCTAVCSLQYGLDLWSSPPTHVPRGHTPTATITFL